MKTRSAFFLASMVIALAFSAGCGGGREVTVTGSVRANADLSHGGLRTVLLAEPGEDGVSPETLLSTMSLPVDDATFAAEIRMHGETLHVHAFADYDENGACSAADSTGRAVVTVGEGDTSVDLELELDGRGECPTFE